MTAMYRLAKEQLSQQYHYDFGLRALRSVLLMAGAIRRDYPTVKEDHLLMRALRDSNIPKLIKDDTPLFMGLVQDLFPGMEFEAATIPQKLAEACEKVLELHRYTIVDEQVSFEGKKIGLIACDYCTVEIMIIIIISYHCSLGLLMEHRASTPRLHLPLLSSFCCIFHLHPCYSILFQLLSLHTISSMSPSR
ncbi:unnamed protein product [Trichobilharzia regenti]|nr:unnamed protein product [Trichobilharzia regenti]